MNRLKENEHIDTKNITDKIKDIFHLILQINSIVIDDTKINKNIDKKFKILKKINQKLLEISNNNIKDVALNQVIEKKYHTLPITMVIKDNSILDVIHCPIIYQSFDEKVKYIVYYNILSTFINEMSTMGDLFVNTMFYRQLYIIQTKLELYSGYYSSTNEFHESTTNSSFQFDEDDDLTTHIIDDLSLICKSLLCNEVYIVDEKIKTSIKCRFLQSCNVFIEYEKCVFINNSE